MASLLSLLEEYSCNGHAGVALLRQFFFDPAQPEHALYPVGRALLIAALNAASWQKNWSSQSLKMNKVPAPT